MLVFSNILKATSDYLLSRWAFLIIISIAAHLVRVKLDDLITTLITIEPTILRSWAIPHKYLLCSTTCILIPHWMIVNEVALISLLNYHLLRAIIWTIFRKNRVNQFYSFLHFFNVKKLLVLLRLWVNCWVLIIYDCLKIFTVETVIVRGRFLLLFLTWINL